MISFGGGFDAPANLEASRASSKISGVNSKTLLGKNHFNKIRMGLKNLSRYNPINGRYISLGPMTLSKGLLITY
jgi:hypothetical protein